MESGNYYKLPKVVVYGVYFLLAGLIINYLFREVFHSVQIDKIVLFSDPEGYFQYLPYFFLRDWDEFSRLPWTIPYAEGKTMSVFTCGVSILWAPFYLVAHFISLFFNLDADGYGNVYYGFVLVAALFYVFAGLYFLYRLLLKEFGSRTSLLTVSLLFLGTNVFYYTMILGAGMSHAYSFSMISLYLYFTHRYFETGRLKHLLLFAFPLGIAVLIRPTNIIAGLYFFLFGWQDGKSLVASLRTWVKKPWVLLVVLIAGLIVAFPQMMYWFKVTGRLIYYSYQEQGFPYLLSPKIGTVLFGKYNGWFLYTPLVLFALYGLIRSVAAKKYNSLAVLVILLLAVYINASWWAPTFSAAVGQRAMIDFLPMLAFPLAVVVNGYFRQSRGVRIALLLLLAVVLFYNIQFAFRYDPYEWWDKPFTWAKFWRTLSF